MSEWQPIETAPKDKFILGYGRPSKAEGSAMALVRWVQDDYDRMEVVRTDYDPVSGKIIAEHKALVKSSHGYWNGDVEPKFWQSLPEPPK